MNILIGYDHYTQFIFCVINFTFRLDEHYTTLFSNRCVLELPNPEGFVSILCVSICCDIPPCVTTTGHFIVLSEMKSPDLRGHTSNCMSPDPDSCLARPHRLQGLLEAVRRVKVSLRVTEVMEII